MATPQPPMKGLLVGTGFFSQFHIEAWKRLPNISMVAVCGLDAHEVLAFSQKWSIPNVYTSFEEALEQEKPDFVDIITPPATHLSLVQQAAQRGVDIICQKPIAPSLTEAQALVSLAEKYQVRLMVHENFRFQPWHRELKKLLDSGVVGNQIYSIYWRMRMGDGWQTDAYLARQPYFRDYPQLLVYETGVHLIDTLRYLTNSDVTGVMSRLHRRNPQIRGEDSGMVFLEFENKIEAILDMSRYNESSHHNPRYTFAECLFIDTNGGTLRLFPNGSIEIQPLGLPPTMHFYPHNDHGFAGDCVFACQQHFVDSLLSHQPFETSGKAYLKNLEIQEQIYAKSPFRTETTPQNAS